jgi:CHASE2 domain-containing sensor protein
MKRVLNILIPGVLSLIISWLFVLVPFSLSLFNTSQSIKEQYDLMDAFLVIKNSGKNYSARATDDINIAIVDISRVFDRDSIADVLETILAQDPLVLGFDVSLSENYYTATEERLSSILKNNPKVVFPCRLLDEEKPNSTSFLNVSRQFFLEFEEFPYFNESAANVDMEGMGKMVRKYTPHLYLRGKKVETFPIRILHQLDSLKYLEAIGKGDNPRYINFRKASFIPVLGYGDVFRDNLDLLKGRIVLVGDLADEADRFNTPIDSRLSGVALHAATLDTIFNGHTIKEIPRWLSVLIAFIVSCLTIMFFRQIKRKTSWSGIWIPLVQTLLIFIFICLSYCLFAGLCIYIQPIYILLAIGFVEVSDTLYDKLLSIKVKR